MRRNSKVRFVYCLITAFVAACLLVSFVFYNLIFAEAGSGNQLGGSCSKGQSTPYWDSCYGATWRYYEIGQSSATFEGGVANMPATVKGTKNAPGGTISGCEKYGGFYVLGLEVYIPSTMTSLNYQRGIVRTNLVVEGGGKYNFRKESNSASWDTAKTAFEAAEKANATNGYTWQSNLGWFCYDKSWGPPPETPPTTDDVSSSGSVWSRSGVSTRAQGDVSNHIEKSDDDGKVTLKISTDMDSVQVDFFHEIHYTGIAKESGSRDVYDNVPIKWNTNWSGDVSGSVGQGTFNTDGVMSNSGKEATRTSSYTIPTKKGETVTYCQKIGYSPKRVTMKGDPVTDSEGHILYYHYRVVSATGSEDSEACIEITRPTKPTDDPEPETYPGPKISGGNGVDVLYVGEDTDVSWSSRVKGVPTRRYVGFQTANYLIYSNQGYSETIGQDNESYVGADVCSYSRTLGSYDCQTMDGNFRDAKDDNSPFEEKYGAQKTVITPDLVGDKYCNTMGYKFEYWYGVEKNGSVSWYKEDGGKPYWVIFGSVCRTIAKKPSVAVWNGSIITNEGVGVTAISSSRYTNTGDNRPGVALNDSKTKFGSWTEHLAVIGGSAKDFASGSTLTMGAKGACLGDILNCSPLTISNMGTSLGNSGVLRNSSYQNRLQSFLKNKARVGGDINADFGNGTTGTRIFKYSGSQTLNHNITYADGPYDSIYQLPQNIIFVDGDLTISSDVTRIDAWLIVTGKINTCGNFNGTTEADSLRQRRSFCTSQLAINGPVVANGGLELNRSYGSDPIVNSVSSFQTNSERNSPAEIFNLRQDSYLWAYAQAGRYDSSYTESYSRELAPRY